jgi:hypothetical protein
MKRLIEALTLAAAVLACLGLSRLHAQGGPASAVAAGELKATPTINCIGLYLPVEGDLNGNASATLEYREVPARGRAGAGAWKKAMPLMRVVPKKVDVEASTIGGRPSRFLGLTLSRWSADMRNYLIDRHSKNYLAGSLFNLTPDATYEIKVTLSDPDGGGASKTVTASTRSVPVIPKDGTRIQVTGGGDALARAVANAEPGNIFVVHAGTYDQFAVSASGTADKPICITPAGDGEVVIQGPTPEQEKSPGTGTGVTITGSYVYVNGLRIRSFYTGILVRGRPGVTNVSVTRCNISGTWTCVHAECSDSYFADNFLKGVFTSGTEGHGFEFENSWGNVACHNFITHVADAGRFYPGTRDSDFHANDIYLSGDDAFELDYSGPNERLWDNRFSFTGANGISFQPYVGGPAYLVRNLIFQTDENCIKDRFESAGAILINNTMVGREATQIPMHVWGRNNLFFRIQPNAWRCFVFHHTDLEDKTLDLDYDGYGAPIGRQGGPEDGKVLSLDDLRKLSGCETHGIEIPSQERCFANPFPTELPRDKRDMEFRGPHPDLSLKAGSPAIDAGVVVPNVIEEFKGKAPDLGALEFGAPAPRWGPRPQAP